MAPVVRLFGDKPSVPTLDQCRVTVPELVRDDLETVTVPQGLNGVGVAPVVERRSREFYRSRCLQMLVQCAELTHREYSRVVGELLRVVREGLPSPELGSADDAVPPCGLPSSRVDGSLREINIPASQSLNDLPLDARGGHESLDRSVGHGQRTDQRLRLHTVKPAGLDAVRSGTGDIADDVRRDHITLAEPFGETRERGAITVLRATGTFKLSQELADALLCEQVRRENISIGDQAPDLNAGLLARRGPLVNERREIGRGEGIDEALERPGFIRIVKRPEFGLPFDDEQERSPYAVMLESFHHALDIVRDFFRRRAAREDPRSSIGERDPGLEPAGALRTVRHGSEATIAATCSATCHLETGLTQ